ncbi:MAG: ankyrin repeat domain-containing protein [Capnocytophaga sp.]|nr:ankyrin repeat domain-containing protein [Capnocytophaga sp.]
MRKIIIASSILFSTIGVAQNTLLDLDFYNEKTTIAQIQNEVAKGNSISEMDKRAFDPATFAILQNSPVETIIYIIESEGNGVHKVTHDKRDYLHWASFMGNVPLVKYLIDNGANIYSKDSRGATPFVFAASNGQTNKELYETFFKAGVNPKYRHDNGETLLLLAIPFDDENLTLTNYFISKGMKLKDKDKIGNTAFDYASKKGNLPLMKNVRKKIKPTGTALPMAAKGLRRQPNTKIGVYHYLIENEKINPNSKDETGANALNYLAAKQDLEAIQFLLSKGSKADNVDNEGNTPLMNACSGKNLEIVKLLNVQNINAINKKGESALLIAVKKSSPEIVKYLIDNGANTKIIDKNGDDVISSLIESYKLVKPNEKSGFDEKVLILDKYNISLKSVDNNGNTALHKAVATQNLDLVKKVLQWGIDINQLNKNKETALIKAAMSATNTDILEFLVAKGANKNSTTEFGETAYDLASENEALKQKGFSLEFLK